MKSQGHIKVLAFGEKILKTWIYGNERVYSIHEDMEKAADYGPRIDDEPEAEYFKLTSIDLEEVKRASMAAKFTSEIEACGENLEHLRMQVVEKETRLTTLKAQRDDLLTGASGVTEPTVSLKTNRSDNLDSSFKASDR